MVDHQWRKGSRGDRDKRIEHVSPHSQAMKRGERNHLETWFVVIGIDACVENKESTEGLGVRKRVTQHTIKVERPKIFSWRLVIPQPHFVR